MILKADKEAIDDTPGGMTPAAWRKRRQAGELAWRYARGELTQWELNEELLTRGIEYGQNDVNFYKLLLVIGRT